MAVRISRRLRRNSISRWRCIVTRASGSAADASTATIAVTIAISMNVYPRSLLFALGSTRLTSLSYDNRCGNELRLDRSAGWVCKGATYGELRRALPDGIELNRGD